MAKFQEVFTASGVDENATPTGMIIPLTVAGGAPQFNLVRLTGATASLRLAHSPMINHQELSGNLFFTAASLYLASLGYDADIPFTVQPNTRYFAISGTHPLRSVEVTAVGPRGIEARLQVAVLKPRVVNLSIRPVQVRGAPQSDALVFHSKKPFDVKIMVDHMNMIWRQANVVFNLVSSAPAPIIDEARIAKAYGLSSIQPLPKTVIIDRVRDILNEQRDQKAELTLFLVEQCGQTDRGGSGRNISTPDGVSDHEFPVALIGDSRAHIHELLAHEAGHLIGRPFNGGKNYPDLDASSLC